MTENEATVPVRANPPGTAGRILAWFSGAAAVALSLLALVLIGALILASLTGKPGPVIATVVVHVLAAIVCLVLQRFADRYPGRTRTLCGWTILVIVLAVFALYWWF